MALLEKLQSLSIRAALVLFILGVLVSLFGSLIGNVGLWATIMQPVIYGSMMSLVGAGVFFVLKKFVPEVIEEFEVTPVTEENEGAPEAASTDEAIHNTEALNAEGSPAGAEISANYNGPQEAAIPKSARKKVAGDGDLLVEGVPIKNEPKLMADAIKHLLDAQSE